MGMFIIWEEEYISVGIYLLCSVWQLVTYILTKNWGEDPKRVKFRTISRVLTIGTLFIINGFIIWNLEKEILFLLNFIAVFIVSTTSEIIPQQRLPIRPSK